MTNLEESPSAWLVVFEWNGSLAHYVTISLSKATQYAAEKHGVIEELFRKEKLAASSI